MKRPRTPESAVLRACLHWLALNGVVAWRNNAGAGMFRNAKQSTRSRDRFVRFGGPRGASDIIGYTRSGGRAVFVETKASDGTQSPEQEAFIAAARVSGAFACIVHSLDELIAEAEAQAL